MDAFALKRSAGSLSSAFADSQPMELRPPAVRCPIPFFETTNRRDAGSFRVFGSLMPSAIWRCGLQAKYSNDPHNGRHSISWQVTPTPRPMFLAQENDWIVWSNSSAGYGLARNALSFGNKSSEGLIWPVVMMI
jgi:hypothetical protein